MSLRAAAPGFWRRSNLRINEEIASGKGQDRHQWLDQYSVADIAKLIQAKKTEQKRRRPKVK